MMEVTVKVSTLLPAAALSFAITPFFAAQAAPHVERVSFTMPSPCEALSARFDAALEGHQFSENRDAARAKAEEAANLCAQGKSDAGAKAYLDAAHMLFNDKGA